jgi:hypothetical protein
LRWKPQVGARGDEHAAVVLVERLGVDEAACGDEHAAVVEMLIASMRALRAVGGELLEHGAINGPEVHAMVAANR